MFQGEFEDFGVILQHELVEVHSRPHFCLLILKRRRALLGDGRGRSSLHCIHKPVPKASLYAEGSGSVEARNCSGVCTATKRPASISAMRVPSNRASRKS